MAPRTIAIKIILAFCIAHAAWAQTTTPAAATTTPAAGATTTDAGSAGSVTATTTDAAPTTTADPTANDLQLTSEADDIETGLDKHFFVECMYNRSVKTDGFGVMSMKLEHQGVGKTNFEQIASIVINFGHGMDKPPSVSQYKDLGGVVSGILSPNGMDETFIKFEWIYPSSDVVGDYKCSVSTMQGPDTQVLTETITITETTASLPTVIERVVNIDLGLDAIIDQITKIDAKALISKNKIFHNELKWNDNTYLLAKNMWSSTVAAQTLCQIHGAYLVEIDDDNEWAAIKASLAGENGPILVGATNKLDKQFWQFMRENSPITYADWSSKAEFTDKKRCMTLTKGAKAGEGWKMNTNECTGMQFEAFICEKPASYEKK